MLLNLQNQKDIDKYNELSELYKKTGATVDLLKKKNTRTTLQNSALHLYFTIISSQLNELGLEYHYYGLKGTLITTMYTPNIVKEFFWKPIQMALFNIKSTKKINTEQINNIIDVITKFFSEKGVLIEFPRLESLKNKTNASKRTQTKT